MATGEAVSKITVETHSVVKSPDHDGVDELQDQASISNVGTVVMTEAGTETITVLGTEFGTAVHGATTVLLPTQTNELDGKLAVQAPVKTTGELQPVGTGTVDGTQATDDELKYHVSTYVALPTVSKATVAETETSNVDGIV
jgi:hypothetical protein